MPPNLLDLTRLASGTPRQKAAFQALQETRIMENLQAYSPTLAGTLPLDIETDQSDLDIICQAKNLDAFQAELTRLLSCHKDFRVERYAVRGQDSVIGSFFTSGFEFEVFGQDTPVHLQYAVVHLHVEARLLALATPEAKSEIRRLKKSGLKTEPAFAHYFELTGDPYDELYRLAALSDAELTEIAQRRRR